MPTHIRLDSGLEFLAKAVQSWITGVGARTAYIAPGSPRENGYVKSFNGKLREELLDCEVFNTRWASRLCHRRRRRSLTSSQRARCAKLTASLRSFLNNFLSF